MNNNNWRDYVNYLLLEKSSLDMPYNDKSRTLTSFQDKEFGDIKLFTPHSNPEAEMASTIEQYEKYSILGAYKGETFYWGKEPTPGAVMKNALLFKSFQVKLLDLRITMIIFESVLATFKVSVIFKAAGISGD